MTLDEAFDAIVNETKDLKWSSCCGEIRGASRDDVNHHFCPVTALCYKRKGLYFSTARFQFAAKALELPAIDAEQIATAADCYSTEQFKKIRDKLNTLLT